MSHPGASSPERRNLEGQGMQNDESRDGSGSGSSDEEEHMDMDADGQLLEEGGMAKAGDEANGSSRPRGESSIKRKEQNRVAQRAFRKRQKAYFKDLEREVIDKGCQLRVITRNNEYLLQTMKQLQNENLALKASKCPNGHALEAPGSGFVDGLHSFAPTPGSPLSAITQLASASDLEPLRSPTSISDSSMRRISDDAASTEQSVDAQQGESSRKSVRRRSGAQQPSGARKSTYKRKAEDASLDVDMLSPTSARRPLDDTRQPTSPTRAPGYPHQSPLSGWQPLQPEYTMSPQYPNGYPLPSPGQSFSGPSSYSSNAGGIADHCKVAANPYTMVSSSYPTASAIQLDTTPNTKTRARRYSEALGKYHARSGGSGDAPNPASGSEAMMQGSVQVPTSYGTDVAIHSLNSYNGPPQSTSSNARLWQNPPAFYPNAFHLHQRSDSLPDSMNSQNLNSIAGMMSQQSAPLGIPPNRWGMDDGTPAFPWPHQAAWVDPSPGAGILSPTTVATEMSRGHSGHMTDGSGSRREGQTQDFKATLNGSASGASSSSNQGLRHGADATMMPVMGVITPMDGNGPSDYPFSGPPESARSPLSNPSSYPPYDNQSHLYHPSGLSLNGSALPPGFDSVSPSGMFRGISGTSAMGDTSQSAKTMLGITITGAQQGSSLASAAPSPYPYNISPGGSPGRLL